MSSLIMALDNQDRQATARILSTMPSEVSIRDNEERVALHYAAETMDIETFTSIYEQDPALIDSQDAYGYTPLMIAVMSGRTEVVEYLVTKGANLRHVDKEGHSAVHWAVVCGQLETLTLILEKGADPAVPDLMKAHPLHYATAAEEISHDTAISILHTLLRKGAHVNCVDIDERTPILWAASNGNSEVMMSLKQAGGDMQAVDRDRLGVLHCAASHGYHEIIEIALQCIPRKLVDARDRSGHTPLFYAVTHGHFEAARILLTAGSNPNHQDSRLRTASHCAAAKGQLRMLKLLKQFGASFEIQNYRGDLPVHEAIQTGSKDVTEWLIQLHPSSLDATSHEGRTGLHLAAATGNIEMVVYLCGQRCQINPLMLYRNNLYTPLDLAKRKDHQVVVDYLKMRHEAKEASEIPEEERLSNKIHFEEQIVNAKLNRGKVLRQENSGELSTRRIRRRRTSSEMLIKATQTITPEEDSEERLQTKNRRPLTTGQIRVPRSTSTTDLTTNTTKDKYEDRIERILQEEIMKAIEERRGEKNVLDSPRAITKKSPRKASSGDSSDDEDIIMKRRVKAQKSSNDTKNIEGDVSSVPEHDIDHSLLGKSISDSSDDEENDENDKKTSNRPKSAKLRGTGMGVKQPSQSSLKKAGSVSSKSKVVRLNTEEKDEISESSTGSPSADKKMIMSKRKKTSKITSKKCTTKITKNSGEKKSRKSLQKRKNLGEYETLFRHFLALSPEWRMPGVRVRREPEFGDAGDYGIFEDDWEEIEAQPVGKDARRRYIHEKAIFQELTHLKRMQIQYGKVQEKVLVRSLVGNFCKMHGLNPADFKFYTFYAWEKFLYDQLKMIYLEERERLSSQAGFRPKDSTMMNPQSRMTRFETRLKQARAVPLNDKVRELTRIYGNSSMITGARSPNRKHRESADGRHSKECKAGNGKRCECIGKHLLIKQEN
ncbi:unnamed protein product, partial [Mesorhabditis belari]|uniref:ANK_REP_REGION domain-containing protein n=1 Tax=Mesorhabditis belari TaxID=2138241 RepID=A0AAF3EIP7_9BILA